MTNQPPPLDAERVRNYRAWCAARVGSLSGADIGVALADHYLRATQRESGGESVTLLPLGGRTSNNHCLALVEAVRKAMAEPHGDFIDQGLILVRVLAEAGYRVAALSASQRKECE